MSYTYPSRVFAHRGGGTLAPENTLAGLRLAHAMGFKAVEFDVMLAKQDVPVLMHDCEFGRTVQGDGRIDRFTAAELARMDAGAWLDQKYTGEPVPSFEQAARFCRAHNIFMNIEIKPAPDFEAQTGRVVAELTQRLFSDEPDRSRWPLLSSFKPESIEAARAAAPNIDRAMLYAEVPKDWREELAVLGCVALHTNQKKLTSQQAVQIKAAGYGLFVYTVNDPARAKEMFRMGVNALCTDRLDLIPPDFA